ncbi:MAG TPA: sulfatase-like hydrolase/transferase [Edaphobacter sp.]|nr:sulfatase-like hydrolase/transferase [Edaphobacter sp.]
MVWLAFTLLLWFARKPGWFHIIIWTSVVILLPWLVLRDWFTFTNRQMPYWLRGLGMLSPIIICVIVFLARRPSFAPLFKKICDFSELLLGFASLSALVVVCQLLWFAWQAHDQNASLPLHRRQSAVVTASPRPRIIWILLDELSYQQVYEQRFPGLHLPAFDLLADQATVFTHVVPAGVFTENVIPSLMTGLPVDKIRASTNGRQLTLHNPKNGEWIPFEAHQTVFQDALDSGYNTAVAGWFNPYCRILPQVLDECLWSSYGGVAGGMYSNQSIAWNTRQFVLSHLGTLLSLLSPGSQPRNTILDTQFHQKDYLELFAAADKLLINPDDDFVFLHMPVPHPGGIYDRKKAAFATYNSSYIDNLALADRYLAHLRLALEQQGEWNSSAVIVMGDHSWRTKLLLSWPLWWTPEDEAASHGGQFDDRPAYIVKLPNQQQGSRIDDRFDAVRTRALLDGILADRIKTPEDLAAWVRQGK